MAKLPGSCGYPFVSDTSIEFYRNPEEYISKRLQESSNIFQSRLLNYKTVFVCSYDATREILEEKGRDFEHGYRSFLFNSYGDNILFEDGESASHLRGCMLPIFNDFARYESTMEKLCKQFFSSMTPGDGDNVVISNVYETFKTLMTKLCLQLFLGFDDDNSTESTESISELATLHWHGIISVPVSLKVPFAGESGWSKAVAAKDKLLDIIRDKIIIGKTKSTEACNKSVFSSLLNLPFKNDRKDIEQHVLLFISALIPKAFSSIITSFIIEMSGEEREDMREKARTDDSFLERVLLEVQRLRPPFFGGRRIAIRDTNIGGYHVPKGHAVVYVSHFAHRDEKVFKNPEKFDPDRWLNWDGPLLAADKTFTFGRGERRCIGHKLIHDILWYITKELLKNYDWSSVSTHSETPYKLLPVSRPVEVVSMTFERHGA